jgi:hypothetical protein
MKTSASIVIAASIAILTLYSVPLAAEGWAKEDKKKASTTHSTKFTLPAHADFLLQVVQQNSIKTIKPNIPSVLLTHTAPPPAPLYLHPYQSWHSSEDTNFNLLQLDLNKPLRITKKR